MRGHVNLLAWTTGPRKYRRRWPCSTTQSIVKKNRGTGTIANQSSRVRIAVLSIPRDIHSPSERVRSDVAFSVHSGLSSKMTDGSTAHVSSKRLNTKAAMVIVSPGVTLTSRRPSRYADQKTVGEEASGGWGGQAGGLSGCSSGDMVR